MAAAAALPAHLTTPLQSPDFVLACLTSIDPLVSWACAREQESETSHKDGVH